MNVADLFPKPSAIVPFLERNTKIDRMNGLLL